MILNKTEQTRYLFSIISAICVYIMVYEARKESLKLKDNFALLWFVWHHDFKH